MAEDIRLYKKYVADEKYNDAFACASAEEKKNLTIEDLLKKFEETSGTVSDRVALG